MNFRGSLNLTLFYRNSIENPQFGFQKFKLSKDNFRGEFPPSDVWYVLAPPYPRAFGIERDIASCKLIVLNICPACIDCWTCCQSGALSGPELVERFCGPDRKSIHQGLLNHPPNFWRATVFPRSFKILSRSSAPSDRNRNRDRKPCLIANSCSQLRVSAAERTSFS